VPGGAAGLQNQSGDRKVPGGFDSLPSPPRKLQQIKRLQFALQGCSPLVAQNQMRVDPNCDNFHYIPLLFLDDDCDKFLSRLDEIRFGEKCLLIRRITRTNSILLRTGVMLRENRSIIHGRRKNDRDIRLRNL
jgi:hypothetical protein